MNKDTLHNKSLLVLLVFVTLAFIWIMLPFYGAVFWAVILGILFAPMQRRLLIKCNRRRNLTSLLTLLACLVIAILPMIIVGMLLLQEGANLYKSIENGQLDIAGYIDHAKHMLPTGLQHLLDRMGMGNLAGLRDKITKSAMEGSQYVASQAFSFGQGTFDFIVSFGIMLYLLFFFLRDGHDLVRRIRAALPLADQQQRRLQLKFNRVVRATVKGNLLVAVTQGALGGCIFWYLDISSALLWAVLMAFMSLLPAVGAGIVWGPVAGWFVLNGDTFDGIVLALFGVFVIGLVDNVLRPILVGKDTRMPDYLVLVSTMGGLAVFGLNGFVIGPLIAALFMSGWSIYSETQQQVRLPRDID
ncbi:AI-2E family transporter [Pseudomonas sp. dw_358]|uniref:AI-2E family transporter n=1 Tax=Pseudomonas sp. dw_358 TaxID=2720083 RepID=UPI001BD64965|nr:AI-2E family transporter [Pseudomonas sp. dw_358]